MKTANLWLSVVVSLGVLLGVGMGSYITSNSEEVLANPDAARPPCTQTDTKFVGTEECVDGSWSAWNLSDNATRVPGYYNMVIPPHSRVYIGVTKTTRKVKTYSCGIPRWAIDRIPWRIVVTKTNNICGREQRPPKQDPEDSAVSTIDTTIEEVGEIIEQKEVPIYE